MSIGRRFQTRTALGGSFLSGDWIFSSAYDIGMSTGRIGIELGAMGGTPMFTLTRGPSCPATTLGVILARRL